jgi:phage terminase large subunit
MVFVNDKYMPLFNDEKRIEVLYGGAGSGKSHFVAQKILIRILLAISRGLKHRILALRKTQPAVRHSVFELFKHYINAWGIKADVKESTMDINFIGGSQIKCAGLDDPDKIKSFEGMTSAWLEEATEFNPMDLTQIDFRLRGESPLRKQIYLSFNPVNELSWLNKRFCENVDENATVVQSNFEDNRFLDEEYIERLRSYKDMDENLWRIYGLGEWGILENLIYSNYEIINELSRWPDEFDEVIYGLDHGYNSPAALVEVGILDEEIYLRELLYESKLQPQALIERMRDLDVSEYSYIYPDVSRPEINDQIYDAGFNIARKEDVKNNVKSGLDFLKTRKPKIHGASDNLIKEIRSYKYKEDRDGNVLEEPVKAFDHLMDAVRYAAYSYFGAMDLIPKVLGSL